VSFISRLEINSLRNDFEKAAIVRFLHRLFIVRFALTILTLIAYVKRERQKQVKM